MRPTDPEKRLEELARKWLDGTITATEQEEFAQWYNQDQDVLVHVPESRAGSEDAHRGQILAGIRRRLQPVVSRSLPLWKSVAAAAVLLVMIATGVYLLPDRISPPATGTLTTLAVHDAAPGGNKAFLTFGDGSVLSLDSQQNGILKDGQGIRIRKEGGLIVYETLDSPNEPVAYHTITTPRGGQYRLRLPDGSMVWLNSASSLRYPTRFISGERYVELTGEAFFEIVPLSGDQEDATRKIPFLVNVNDRQTIRVLGTQFNVNSYNDEKSVKTTLLEGSVEVTGKKGTKALLMPNQQAHLSENGELLVTDAADMEEAIAWKNGQLLFKDADIRDIMRQIARWYDVDIVYDGEIPKRLFTGGISRDSKLSSLLQILETSGIRFRVDGKHINVIP